MIIILIIIVVITITGKTCYLLRDFFTLSKGKGHPRTGNEGPEEGGVDVQICVA